MQEKQIRSICIGGTIEERIGNERVSKYINALQVMRSLGLNEENCLLFPDSMSFRRFQQLNDVSEILVFGPEYYEKERKIDV